MDRIRDHSEPGAAIIRGHLSSATETVSFEMALSDAEGTGLAISIAAASWLAETGDGTIQADDLGWMLPSGREVRFLCEF